MFGTTNFYSKKEELKIIKKYHKEYIKMIASGTEEAKKEIRSLIDKGILEKSTKKKS